MQQNAPLLIRGRRGGKREWGQVAGVVTEGGWRETGTNSTLSVYTFLGPMLHVPPQQKPLQKTV